MSYHIQRKYDHYEVYINGKFYCTADNHEEAAREVEEYFSKGA
jgi:hypothetical protein